MSVLHGTFPGRVDDNAVLLLKDKAKLTTLLKALRGQRVTLTLSAEGEKRSLPQNAYLHAEPFKKIAEHMGESVTAVKYALMGECFGWMTDKITGKEVPVKPHTSKMTKKDCTLFIDWLLPWSLEFFEGAVQIMPPQQWFELNPDAAETPEED